MRLLGLSFMRLLITTETKLQLAVALRHMVDALDILDEVNAPGEIGSTLDLAIARLDEAIGRGGGQSSVQVLVDQLEREMSIRVAESEPNPSPWEIQPA